MLVTITVKSVSIRDAICLPVIGPVTLIVKVKQAEQFDENDCFILARIPQTVFYTLVSTFTGSGISNGVILQRFPETDWNDTPFIEGIEWVSFQSILVQITIN